MSFLSAKHKPEIEKLIKLKAKKFHLRLAEAVNMGNHIHIKIKIKRREDFQKFLKSITTLIARRVTGARRNKKFGRFWNGLAYTRILKSSFEELQLRQYFEANRKERDLGPQAREAYLNEMNRWLYQLRYKQKLLSGQYKLNSREHLKIL